MGKFSKFIDRLVSPKHLGAQGAGEVGKDIVAGTKAAGRGLKKAGSATVNATKSGGSKVANAGRVLKDDAVAGGRRMREDAINAGKETGALALQKKPFSAGAHAVKNSIEIGARPFDYALDKTADGAVNLGIKAGKSMFKDDPNGKTFFNAYTGKRESKAMIGTAAVLGAGYAYGGSMYRINTVEKPGETSYEGEAPVFKADGTGGAPTLGASGDMVLGLHKSRKGM